MIIIYKKTKKSSATEERVAMVKEDSAVHHPYNGNSTTHTDRFAIRIIFIGIGHNILRLTNKIQKENIPLKDQWQCFSS